MSDPLLRHLETLDPALVGARSPITIRRTHSWPAGLRHRTTLVEHAEGSFILRRAARALADLANEHRALLAVEGRCVGPRALHLGQLRGDDYLLVEYLSGREVVRLTESRLRTLAALLARLHETEPDGLRDADPLRAMEHLLTRIPEERLRDPLRVAASILADRGLPAGARRFVHGDVQRENLIARRGRLRLIDFEEAGAGDPAFELAEVEDHLALRRDQFDRLLEEYFRRGGEAGIGVRVAAWRPVKHLLNVVWTVAWRAEAAPEEWPGLVREALPSLGRCQRAGLLPPEFALPATPDPAM